MVDQATPWPKQGPASYFPPIEKKYGRSIAEWPAILVAVSEGRARDGAGACQRARRVDPRGQDRPPSSGSLPLGIPCCSEHHLRHHGPHGLVHQFDDHAQRVAVVDERGGGPVARTPTEQQRTPG